MKTIDRSTSPDPLVRDERDLPVPLDVLGARFHAAKIRFRVLATQTGYGLELVLPEVVRNRRVKKTIGQRRRYEDKVAAKRAGIVERAEMIWLGTR